jgi:RND family efflux transporter MFP subunit
MRWLMPPILLAAAFVLVGLVVWLKPADIPVPFEPEWPLVTIQEMRSEAIAVEVLATGTVQAAQHVRLIPEVSGRVNWVDPRFVRGGRFQRGEVLARIDSADYRAQLIQGEGQVARARLGLQLEEAQQATAEWSWAHSDDERPDPGSLALREPYVAAARADLASAEVGLEQAQRALDRTRLMAPYDLVVLEETLSEGQVIGPGQPVATLAGTETFRVSTWIPVSHLQFIAIPGVQGEPTGSVVTATQRLGDGREVARVGHVVSMGGQLDSQTRAAEVLVDIADPMDDAEGGLPLLVGAFVQMSISGTVLDDVVRVPRRAVVEGNKVWIVDENDKLDSREITVAWREIEHLLVNDGLRDGDRVVTSQIPTPSHGLPVVIATPSPSAVE